jgi:hypothetical protein
MMVGESSEVLGLGQISERVGLTEGGEDCQSQVTVFFDAVFVSPLLVDGLFLES